jgi:PIN domain nuclease of toxin-antitoxin system
VRLLLDSHVLLWWLVESPRLSDAAYEAIADPSNEIAVSAATPWELEIKRAAGRLRAPQDLVARLRAARFQMLPITAEHGVAAAHLPRHHRDPFDRMLIAQAQIEGLTIVTRDPRFAPYSVATMPA